MNIIEVNNLTKSYGKTNALKQLSFSIEENKITGIIGRNGAGKTTMLNILAGFIKPTSGEVSVFSENPFDNLFVSSQSILVDDTMMLPTSLSLSELLKEASRFYEQWDETLAQRLFDYFSFDPNQHHDKLSKGKKSTFNTILGLASRCPLTIFDEPTIGMDEAVRKDFYRALLKDYLAHPRTILLSSHHLNEIEDLLEDVLLINDGATYLHMPVSELKSYAVGLKGPADLVKKWSRGRINLSSKNLGPSQLYVVLENDFSAESLEEMKRSGIELSSVSSSDVCVYLTSTSKGGIDDVFSDRETS
ncbi:ABC transporter [Salipaludibacillus keqinensis]|uniref:ABC transporter n=1 Tax=Salipaludibacillus keqinensis TaxID=2045207 RepID=A0A323TIC8_9BACI|nr:ABC transporter ATP-binding protein [Salipaludibacillus keqinensis]PYZ94651.1 ABC transporter [Salipaludibacillus keqinensis]